MNTIAEQLAAFRNHPDQVLEVAEEQLARASDPQGEGSRVFISLNENAVRAAARESAQRYRNGTARLLEGVTISIKDLFDVKGEVTTAGSTVLRSRPPASVDAPAVARLREAGAILVGRTNMTEFAFSGIGINPHYGTPRSLWDRRADGSGRIPGGSSSGGGVSVADGMCSAALGTDTGGSVRLPAVFNGLVGFKPSAYRVPILGGIPLSVAHDSIGPLAESVDDCIRIDAVLSGQTLETTPIDLRGARFLKPKSVIWGQLDPEVERATLAAIEKLKAAGATIVEAPLAPLDEAFNTRNPSISALALDWHAENVGVNGEGYDPRVWQRMLLGRDVTRANLSWSIAYRRFWIDQMNMLLADYDAVLCPTSACIAPEIASVVSGDDDHYFAVNARILRNTGWVNSLDGCAISLPCHEPGAAPVGLQLVKPHASDARLLAVARSVEQCLQQ
ncbi:MAG: amidase [Burkholderiales bacterium]|nr:MAG: amidase [Betaproteobacteria bacterium]TAG84460.1 MAG: amidase [Burkholderiales bacterium]